MRKFLVGAGLATVVAMPALAMQQGSAPPRPDRAATITRAELQAKVQQRFTAIDANHDGVITKAELDARRDKMKQDRQAGRAERRSRLFAMLDTDKNGSISQQEFIAARPGMGAERGKMRRGDGRMGMHGGAMRGGMGARWLERADTNKDGKVTVAEATAMPLARFDRIDADHDGTVTPQERRAARAGWPARRG